MKFNASTAVCLAMGCVLATACIGAPGDSEVDDFSDDMVDDLEEKYTGAGVHETNGFPSVGMINWCTGTLITPRTVLTAAHCVPRDSSAIKNKTFTLDKVEHPVVAAFRHPDYDGSEYHDLGIYILQTAIKNVEPSPLSSKAPYVGQRIVLVGMGSTGGKGNYWMTKKYAGNNTIHEVSPEWFSYKGDVQNCGGDSGGPAFTNGAIIGTVSTGDGNNCSRSTGWNARVDDAIDWIKQRAVGTVKVTR